MTSSPAQLHLMLIEGALRFARQADQAMGQEDEIAGNAALTRLIDVVAEMLAGVRHSQGEINRKLADLYQFVFSTVVSSYVRFDRLKLAEAVRILEFERETWRLACEHIARSSAPEPTTQPMIAPVPKMHAPALGASVLGQQGDGPMGLGGPAPVMGLSLQG